MRNRAWWGACALLLPILCLTSPAAALDPRGPSAGLQRLEFFEPELYVSNANVALDDVLADLPNRAAWERWLDTRAPQDRTRVFIDPRSGAATNLMGAFPLIPGDGVGNTITPADVSQRIGRSVGGIDARAVAEAAFSFVAEHAGVLGIDTRQLGPVRAVQVNPALWQVSIPQQVDGVRVRDARLALTISHGNVVLVGTETWGNVAARTRPAVTARQALDAGFAYAGGRSAADVIVKDTRLELLPSAPREHQVGEAFGGKPGQGYRHRLAWSFSFQRAPEQELWEVLVDAASGAVIAFQDINDYVEKSIVGGVYPLTNTEICPTPQTCGTMQPGWPMAWANTGFAAPDNFTNSGGVYNYVSGIATTTLAGRNVRISDTCGAISASSSTGDIDLGGSSTDHDCVTPGFGGAGNTAASRSGFYELNKLMEQARGWLPSNTWLQGQLTANMNINATCNAFYSSASGTVNFYRSGGGCRNTGEIAAVFDHEWGHAMDDNDAAGALSNSSEAYADIAAIYRLQASCVGHGFFWTSNRGCGNTSDGTGFNQNESQTGSHCDVDCSGVRDADWDKHTDHTPDTALGFVCTHCSSSTGPCGRQVHCAAAPVRQAAWDLVTRDLTSAPFNYDSQTAFIVGNKLFYQGSGNIGLWHACTCGASSDGCGATNGYMQWLAADDDNGNLNDGTPHMTALYNAFNRHGIACASPAAQNGGCAAGPSAAPILSGSAGNYSASLSWSGVSGASSYWVMRTEGHAGCDFGKAKIATVAGTSYTDTGVLAGRDYHYNIVAQGASAACFGGASNCLTLTPTAGTPTPDFTVACSPASLSAQQGGSATSTCTVTSLNGYSSAVALSCAGLPAGSSCSFSPASVTPPAGGSASSTLTVSVSTTAAGTYAFQVAGSDGTLTRSAALSLTVSAPPPPDFTLACSPASLSVVRGNSVSTTCTVGSLNGFSSAVSLSCSGMPSGGTCSFTPNPVTPPAGGSAASTLTFTTANNTKPRTYSITVTGTSGALSHTTTVSLQVTR